MASTVWLAPTANYIQTTLNGAITDSATTIAVNSITNLTAPGYVVIDRTDSSGTATPNAREVVSFTGISGSNLTGCTRGVDGSTSRSHSNGAIVETMLTVGMWNSLATIVGSGFDGSGYLRPIASPASIAIMQVKTMLGASGASVMLNTPEIYFPVLTLSNVVPITSGRFGYDDTNQELVVGNGSAALTARVGSWKSYTPVVVGMSASSPASIMARYATIGKTCVYNVYSRKVGVSNSTSFTIDLPIAAANQANHYLGLGQGTDNTVYQNLVLADIAPAGTVATLSPQGGSALWTASGAKDASFTVIYETA